MNEPAAVRAAQDEAIEQRNDLPSGRAGGVHSVGGGTQTKGLTNESLSAKHIQIVKTVPSSPV